MIHKRDTSTYYRINRLIKTIIKELELDLSGLTIYTEAATGPYLYTPILCGLSGAEKVFAVTDDSAFAKRSEVKKKTNITAQEWGVEDVVDVRFEKQPEDINQADIVTNTGFVRPIDEQLVSSMKSSSVVPLMWEPWEYRGDVDLNACRENEILVMGTDESQEPVNMYPYAGFIAMKLLFELGLEGYKSRTVLLGSGEGTGRSIFDHFTKLDMDTKWFSNIEPDARPYDTLTDYIMNQGDQVDVILVAEHHDDTLLLGPEGALEFDVIDEYAPEVSIGVISGNVDATSLKESGLNYHPESIQPFGRMSYQAYHLGPRGPIELYAAGMKVGEVMARARLDGKSLSETVQIAKERSPAVPLPQDLYPL